MLRVMLLAVALLLVAVSVPAAALSKDEGIYSHPPPEGVEIGDIVFGHSGGLVDLLLPGFWTHVGMAGYDPERGWLVAEALPGEGVVLTPLPEFLERYDTVALAHVAAPLEVRMAAAGFAVQQLGKPYDYNYLWKEVYGPSYYCSELAWAAYMATGGPDLDANPGWSWAYGYAVAPQEVYDDADTVVYYLDAAG